MTNDVEIKKLEDDIHALEEEILVLEVVLEGMKKVAPVPEKQTSLDTMFWHAEKMTQNRPYVKPVEEKPAVRYPVAEAYAKKAAFRAQSAREQEELYKK